LEKDENKRKINLLVKRRGRCDNIKRMLWREVSIMLSREGYNHSDEKCWVKWKNIKQNYYKVKFIFYNIKFDSKIIHFLVIELFDLGSR